MNDGIKTIRVLLLEDDPDYYRLLCLQLRKNGYQFIVDWAETLAAAIEVLGRQNFDIVLTDLSLPDSRGLETVSHLKQHCGLAPIIVLTSLEDDSVERDILAAGAQDYLVKGEASGRGVTREIFHALQRQESMNDMQKLVGELEQSQMLLQEQAELLKKKNGKLKNLYKTAQEFVDNVSHDFRTPLTVIKDYVSIVREGMVGEINGEQQTMLDKVSVRADDLNNMVDDLLDVSKLESGLLGAWRRNVEVADILGSAESLLRQRAEVRGVDLEVDIEEGLPEVYCDAEKVGRVLINLTVNAIKFTKPDGQVRLWAEYDPANRQVVIGVTDNGPGIEKEAIEQIFQRFQQLDSHVKSPVKGFGLGLNIAQQLCRLNLGELSVKSKLGEGSTFSFSVPVADPTEIVRRWLDLRSESRTSLRVVEITIDPATPIGTAGEFDSFLNCMLHRDDLLLPVENHRWLLAMPVDPPESECWFERTRKEYDRANRNRPLGPLPSYETKICVDWDAQTTNSRIIEQFDEIVKCDVSVMAAN